MTSPLVSTAWLGANLDRPDLRILDCSVALRTAPDGTPTFVAAREESQAAHVAGGVFVDVLGELCGGAGIAASSDALALTLIGAPNAAVYDGSLAEWAADPELPLERG